MFLVCNLGPTVKFFTHVGALHKSGNILDVVVNRNLKKLVRDCTSRVLWSELCARKTMELCLVVDWHRICGSDY